jgi:hypothetical protein
LDPNTHADPSDFQDCASFIRTPRPSHCGNINWISGDVINGPMYTHDQFFICGTPTFGRPGSQDRIESASDTGSAVVLSPATNPPCNNNPTYNGAAGNPQTAPVEVPAPSDNTNLLPYATANGKVFTGKTTITLNNGTANVINANASGCTVAPGCSVNLTTFPIIYVTNGSGCSSTYTPYFAGTANYTSANATCGNVFISGAYTAPVTIAAANDIIITGNIQTTLTGSAVAGLVANNFIRVMHAVATRSDGIDQNGNPYKFCDSGDDNVSGYTLTNLRIDAAVLALKHSFIVDNYDCGDPTGSLTVNGAIAQLFRGTVGTTNNGTVKSGYLKNYNYDDRFAFLQPPYLFDLAESAWQAIRETTCTPGSTDPGLAC